MAHLLAGAARRLINPPLGIRRAGIRIFADPIQAVESDLTATALVLSDGKHRLVIVAVDLCLMSSREATVLRERIARAVGTETRDVMINLSHTHSSPALPDFIPDTPEQMRLKQQYFDQLLESVPAAANDATSQLRPARIGSGRGECRIGVYRRAVGPDGKGVLGEVPDAPIDPGVGVIRVDDLQGRPIAVLFSHGCHPVVMGPRAHVASSDFPGAARDVVEKCLGGLSLFLQACGGNINPVGGIGYEVDGRDSRIRVGTILGGEVLQVAADIRTHVRRGEQTVIGPLGNIRLWPWQPVTEKTLVRLESVEQPQTLLFGPLPSPEEARAIHDQWKQTLADNHSRGAHDWSINFATRFVDWSSRLVAAAEHGRPLLEMAVQGLRIGDIVLVGINAEVFFETGLAIQAA